MYASPLALSLHHNLAYTHLTVSFLINFMLCLRVYLMHTNLSTDAVFPFKFLLENFCLLAFIREHLMQHAADNVC